MTIRKWLYDHALRHVGMLPGTMRAYAVPGAAALHHLRWRFALRRTPSIPLEEHIAQTGLMEIEEGIPCDLCGERRVQPLFVAYGPERRKWRYHVVRCPSCGFLYRNPGIKPERLGDLYAKKYSRFLKGHYSDTRPRRYRLVMDAFDPVFADGSGRRVLDFGCGTGLFLQVARERGFETYGVDLSEDSIAEARKHPSGANAYFGAPQDVPEIAAGGFDAVTMWSVLAHLATPVEDLALMRRLLNDDGVLLILTVNAGSLLLKARRGYWSGWTPNHLKVYSPHTLPRLLERAGFGAIVMRPMYGENVELGKAPMTPRQVRRFKRTVDRGNQGNMLRAVAFADPAGPARWGMAGEAVRLAPSASAPPRSPPTATTAAVPRLHRARGGERDPPRSPGFQMPRHGSGPAQTR